MENQLSNAQITESEIKDYFRNIFTYLGDDPSREGLLDTPKRIVKSWNKLYGGYKQNPREVLSTVFEEGSCEEMVGLADIGFYSTC